MFAAADKGHVEVVRTLVKAGANINQGITTHGGATPLYIAAQNGKVEVVRALLEAGVNLNQGRTIEGDTALFIAAQQAELEVVRTLLELGAKAEGRVVERDAGAARSQSQWPRRHHSAAVLKP